jgi:hypothetical protein
MSKLNEEDNKFYKEAAEHAWTPCKHFVQCLGFCPLCLRDYVKGKINVQSTKETPSS